VAPSSSLDAAGLVHVLDGHRGSDARLLAAVGDEAGHWMYKADLDRLDLCVQNTGKAQRANRHTTGDEAAARNGAPASFRVQHDGLSLANPLDLRGEIGYAPTYGLAERPTMALPLHRSFDIPAAQWGSTVQSLQRSPSLFYHAAGNDEGGSCECTR
jgi:hypothetical protein